MLELFATMLCMLCADWGCTASPPPNGRKAYDPAYVVHALRRFTCESINYQQLTAW